MSKINYVKGDATKPIGDGLKIIAHICNNVGAFGAGFVVALSKRWLKPELEYRRMKREDRVLGHVQFVPVTKDIVVANMIAQHDIKPQYGIPPIRTVALRYCLELVNTEAIKTGATIHMPRIGAGLAGGNWSEIEKIINETLTVDVTVYDLK
jgi:O-acetyl-ADP-ribose deacetylase (regulator of RNase III)